jgi:hypothetical protein
MKPVPPVTDCPLSWLRGAQEIARLAVEPVSFCVMLVQASFRPGWAHTVVDDETAASPLAHELTVDGYSRRPLVDPRLVDDPAGVYLDAPDLVFGNLEPGERIGGALLFRDAGSDRLSPLIAFYPYFNAATTGGPVLLEWAPPEAGRVFRLPPCHCHYTRRSP